MAIQAHDLTNLICGTLKITEPTTDRDSSKRVIWKAECICGQHEYGARPQLEKYAGHDTCPGHPFKGKEKLIDGFSLNPTNCETPEHAVALAVWESRRHPERQKGEGNSQPSAKENKTLRDRLGLSGYRTETVTLSQPADILGCKAEKVVFAKQLDGDDWVLLHVALVDANGKRSIASSRKKVPDAEWAALSTALTGMQLVWRERDCKQRTP